MLGNFQHNPGRAKKVLQSVEEMVAYFHAAVDREATHPTEGLINALTTAEVDGDRLSEEEVVANVIVTMVGGQETTTNLIGNGLLTLLRQPDQLERLRADPTLMASAVEELLRYESPSQHTARLAPAGAVLGGKEIPEGAAVIAVMGAANRDPERFADPDRLDLGRQDNRHLAFGWSGPLLLRCAAGPHGGADRLRDAAHPIPAAGAGRRGHPVAPEPGPAGRDRAPGPGLVTARPRDVPTGPTGRCGRSADASARSGPAVGGPGGAVVPEPPRPQPDQLQRGHHHPQGRAVRRRDLPPGLQRDRPPPRGLAHHVRHRRRGAGPGPAAGAELRSAGPRSQPPDAGGGRAPGRAAWPPRCRGSPTTCAGARCCGPGWSGSPASTTGSTWPCTISSSTGSASTGWCCPSWWRSTTPSAPGEPSPLAEPPTQLRRLRPVGAGLDQPTAGRRAAGLLARAPDARSRSCTLPLDHPRPREPRFRGGMVPLSVPAETVGRLREVGQERGRHPVPGAGHGAGRCCSAATRARTTSSSPRPPTCASGRSSNRWSATRSPRWCCGST